MKMYETTQPVERYLNIPLECSCGRTHYAPIRSVRIGSGALNGIAADVRAFGYHHPYLLCDPTTYRIAGSRCEQLLKEAGFPVDTLVLKHLGYDEATLGEIVIHKPDDCDLMIGVGTGSITDMLRYASFKLSLPCFTVATAAPMDGFSASVGIMNVNGLKATMPAHCTELIIGDTDILRAAPFRMTVAGFADLVGKVNALNDWKLAALINGDHYCPSIASLVSDYVDGILSKTDRIQARDPQALGDIMNALLLTGATISLYGSSRPISGAEHHMSHYWEVLGEQRGRPFAMHGEQVAVGTVLALMLAKELLTADIDFDAARAAAGRYDFTRWKQNIERTYGSASGAIIQLEEQSGKNALPGRLLRIDRAEENWGAVRRLLSELRSPEEMRSIFSSVGCPCSPKDIGLDKAVIKDSFMVCKETRARYTVFQLAWDLDVLDALSDRVIAKLESQDML